MTDLDESYEACYVFSPDPSSATARPAKRRKTASHQSDAPGINLPSLFEGQEDPSLAGRRLQLYQDLWSTQEQNLQNVLTEANAETVDHVSEWLDEQADASANNQIPVGFITAGLATSSSNSAISAISATYSRSSDALAASLSPPQCPNLKTALKSIIQTATQAGIDEDEDEAPTKSNKGIRLLNYDLHILHDIVLQKSLSRVIILFKDSEALDGPVLSELIDILNCWLDRIPFILIFEVATSVELFQEKLSRHALRLIKAVVFEAKSSTETLDLLFRCATSPDEKKFLWLGANASKVLLDRQTEHIQSARGFITAMQYMYMLHFYHQPLSILLGDIDQVQLSRAHISAIRALPSFKRYIDDLMDENEKKKASLMLKNDKYLLENIESLLQETRDSLDNMFYALETLRIINSCILSKTSLTWSALYIRAMSGELAESTVIRELSLSIKKLPSDIMIDLLTALGAVPGLDLQDVSENLEILILKQPSNVPLRTEHDTTVSTLRTTVVAQKVSLSKSKAALSEQDEAYSKIVEQIDLTLKEFLTPRIIFSKDLVLHEILVFDSKAQCRDVLGPSPRQAVERALSSPHDYLACECCEDNQGLASTLPATAILYQLYVESGALINVADMWAAFQAILSPEGYEDDEIGEKLRSEHQALFFRALAELKYLGMVKSSRKKADHVAKIRWKGL